MRVNNKTDILFIAPPFSYGDLDDIGPKCPPLGIATIAAYVEQQGYVVKILDAFALGYSFDQIEEEIKEAFQFAEESPFPEASELTTDVFK